MISLDSRLHGTQPWGTSYPVLPSSSSNSSAFLSFSFASNNKNESSLLVKNKAQRLEYCPSLVVRRVKKAKKKNHTLFSAFRNLPHLLLLTLDPRRAKSMSSHVVSPSLSNDNVDMDLSDVSLFQIFKIFFFTTNLLISVILVC